MDKFFLLPESKEYKRLSKNYEKLKAEALDLEKILGIKNLQGQTIDVFADSNREYRIKADGKYSEIEAMKYAVGNADAFLKEYRAQREVHKIKRFKERQLSLFPREYIQLTLL